MNVFRGDPTVISARTTLPISFIHTRTMPSRQCLPIHVHLCTLWMITLSPVDWFSGSTLLPLACRGDQGFLNAYFKGFIDGPLFDPSEDYTTSTAKYMRLPTRYNADIGLYVLNSNRWLLDGDLKLIHYTLGAFKPWDWWCGWLIEEQSRWAVRAC